MHPHIYGNNGCSLKSQRSAKEYRCTICNKTFDSAETLNSHNTMEHSLKSHAPAGVG
jgi:hypothetical protein